MQNWCFIASLIMLIVFFVISLVERNRRHLSELQKWKLKILKFVFLVLSGSALYFGYKYVEDISFKGVVESIYSGLKLFFAAGDLYQTPDAPLNDSSVLSIAYFALYYIICGVAVYCTATAVISIFKNFAALNELNHRGRHKNLCVFSELNDRTLVIAKSIFNETKQSERNPSKVNSANIISFFTRSPYELDKKSKKLSFVFCDVFEQNAEICYELLEGARELGALCVKNDVFDVHERLRNAKCYKNSENRMTRYFLAGNDEAENVRQAIAIADAERRAVSDNERIKNLAIFAFATGEADGEVINSLNVTGDKKATYFIRRMNPSIMLAFNVLANKNNYLVDSSNPDKELNVLVAGLGQYGAEMVKMLSWFYQRHTGGINIHVVDREKNIADRFGATCPGLVEYTRSSDPTDDAQFSIVFHEKTDLYSSDFSRLINNELKNIDAAFVTLGDDDINAEAAIHIRRLLDRAHFDDIAENTGLYLEKDTKRDLVKIFAIVHDDKRCRNFAVGTTHNISFVGNNSEIYAYRNIYDYQKEASAIDTHQGTLGESAINKAINSYNAREYDHLSSLANAYHADLYKELYGSDLSTEEYFKTESKRWNAYMCAYGYVCMIPWLTSDNRKDLFNNHKGEPIRKWERGKWHNGIAPYSRKSPSEQFSGSTSLKSKPEAEGTNK